MQQYLATYTRILKRFALPNHRFEKALVEDGHVFKGIFRVIDGLAVFLVYYKERLLTTQLVISLAFENCSGERAKCLSIQATVTTKYIKGNREKGS